MPNKKPYKKKLRVLIAHNAYQQRGGEDAVVEAEIAMLRSRGDIVECYFRHNDELKNMSSAFAAKETLWSSQTSRDLAGLVKDFSPDVIHVHNTFPLISPALYWAAARASIPIVQTLHNFRLLCPQAIFLREGKICEKCLGGFPWSAIRHRCYRNSVAQTGVISVMLGIHRGIGTYREKITRYIVLNEFCRRKFIDGGLPANKLSIKPNFVDVPVADDLNRQGGLFVGRLAEEKGIAVLLKALDVSPQISVDVVGTGPAEPAVSTHRSVRFHGWQESAVILKMMREAAYLVLPSICYESFPRTLVEAFACGLPVIVSRLGAMAEIVEEGKTGLLFEPDSAEDLTKKMLWAEANPKAMRDMGKNARREYEAKYTAEINYQKLRLIYEEAITTAKCGIPV